MPDLSWIAMVCGSFAPVWSFLRTGLILQALRKASPSQPFVGGVFKASYEHPERSPA